LHVPLSDLAVHTYFDLSAYVTRVLNDKNEDVPAMGAREFRKSR
jgi:hypothetical protein